LNASDGEIGKIREFYFDDKLWIVRYLVVETGFWLNSRKVLILPHALGAVDPLNGGIAVALTRQQVRYAPLIETDKPISQQEEAQLHQHYNWDPALFPSGVPGLMLVPEVTEILEPNPPAKSSEAKASSHLRSSSEILSGYTINAQDAEIGIVNDLIVDDAGWGVRYLDIHTGMLFFGKDKLLAPEWVERISQETAEVFVKLPSAAIKDAPPLNDACKIITPARAIR
jgi:hypothetical protein